MITSIQEYKLLLEKIKKKKVQHMDLFIVGATNNQFEEYSKIAQKHDRTVQIVDYKNVTNLEFPNQIRKFEEQFDGTFGNLNELEISRIYTGNDKDRLIQKTRDHEFVNGDKFKTINDENWIFVNDQTWFLVDTEFTKFLERLHKVQRTAVLLGPDPNKVAQIQTCLKAFQISSEIYKKPIKK